MYTHAEGGGGGGRGGTGEEETCFPTHILFLYALAIFLKPPSTTGSGFSFLLQLTIMLLRLTS